MASSASSTGIQIAQSLPQPLELELHPQRRLLQLGMGLGGAAKNQALVTSGQTLLVITVVQTKSDEGGAEAARSWVGLLHENHRAVDLSRVGCRNRWRIERVTGKPPDRPCSSRDCLIGFSSAIKQHASGESRPRGRP